MSSLTGDLHPTSAGEKPTKATKAKKKPCRVCSEFNAWGKETVKDADSKSAGSGAPSTASSGAKAAVVAGAAAMNAITGAASDFLAVSSSGMPCPPDSKQLGRATWTFLHTMAAYYPDEPSKTQQTEMSTFLDGFSKFYPCHYCADHLQGEMKTRPPVVQSRTILSRWFCDIHNEVNQRLGKSMFDCNKVGERWGPDGPADGSCD